MALAPAPVCPPRKGGKQFGPRHPDFHATKPWIYVSIETPNKMYMLRMEDGRIDPEIAIPMSPTGATLEPPLRGPRLDPNHP
jgi:hypothetical protein